MQILFLLQFIILFLACLRIVWPDSVYLTNFFFGKDEVNLF